MGDHFILINLFVLEHKIMVQQKIEKKVQFYYCFVLSIKGRVTWTNSTDKVHVASSARTFQLVV